MPVTRCPVAPKFPADFTAPVPETLAYSLTLPAALASPALARATTREVLKAHGLHDMLDPALHAVGELTAVAAQFTESSNFYLSLRYRAATLRVIVYDSHPRHAQPHLVTACDTRRRAALRVLACVCRACDGSWGFGEAREPDGGTRMWARLPRAGAGAYGMEAPHSPVATSV
ncbi:ATP-binding protein [Streptomyces sp. ME18-1-4]|uniref:ATP-binding protein n=1 Tax=Streptomyces sp. ME18-1-4 TaxID=3028685 RepID=UPI0029AE1C9D|nr:ATP-binding protein [Streptomyces sp. ME18-1-4]MDX3246086.1 ATP-binding protein [Streptomyces sp. ME18-1-4]